MLELLASPLETKWINILTNILTIKTYRLSDNNIIIMKGMFYLKR